MSWRATRFAPPQPGPRHSADWYDQRAEDVVLAEGDRVTFSAGADLLAPGISSAGPRRRAAVLLGRLAWRLGCFVPCRGGPSASRTEVFPPRLEIAERDGTYVLVDDGPRAGWFYEFVPAG